MLLQRLNEQHKAIEEALRNYGRVTKERDEVRARVAALEHELAQMRQQLTEARAGADQVKELQKKIDEALMAHGALTTENAKLKMRTNEQEEKLKQAEQRAVAAESALKRAETAAANAKEARDETERRIAAALAALQQKK